MVEYDIMAMSETVEVKTPATEPNAKKAKPKAWPDKLSKDAKKVPKNKKAKLVQFDFVGKVESVNIKLDGTSSHQFLFNLINKKGEGRSFLLDASEPLRFSAMASLLTAAFVAKKKVSVRTVANASGLAFAGELEVRTKN